MQKRCQAPLLHFNDNITMTKLEPSLDGKKRCFGGRPNQDLYAKYHDNEWGVPVYDDQKLFEFLVLEGAQAGLNWETVLKKREGYRNAFLDFDPIRVARMSDAKLEKLREDSSIIRNKLKINSARNNAKVFLEIQQEFGSFSAFLWQFVDNKPIVNKWPNLSKVPASTPESDNLSKALKQRGMSFVGSTIMYAYMQAVGLVNDHVKGCWKHGI